MARTAIELVKKLMESKKRRYEKQRRYPSINAWHNYNPTKVLCALVRSLGTHYAPNSSTEFRWYTNEGYRKFVESYRNSTLSEREYNGGVVVLRSFSKDGFDCAVGIVLGNTWHIDKELYDEYMKKGIGNG